MDDIVIYSRKEKYLGTPRGKVAPQVNRISLSTSIVHSTTDRTEPIKNTVSRLLSRTVDLVPSRGTSRKQTTSQQHNRFFHWSLGLTTRRTDPTADGSLDDPAGRRPNLPVNRLVTAGNLYV
jgi:hypothetical protein